MILLTPINVTVQANESTPDTEKVKQYAESIKAMSETPQWQEYLLGLQNKANKKQKKSISQNGNKSQYWRGSNDL